MGTGQSESGQEGDGGENGLNLDVLILGAGAPKGMKVWGPLALYPLPGGETVLGRQVRIIKEAYPGCQVTFVGGFDAEEVFKKLPRGVLAVENEGYDKYTVGRSLEIGLRCCVRSRLLLVYGDLVFGSGFLDGLPKNGSFAILGEKEARDVGVNTSRQKVRLFNYSIDSPKWTQILMLDGVELKELRKLVPNYRDKLVHEILNKIIREGGSIAPHPLSGPLWEIDTRGDLAKVRKELK